MQNAYCSKLLGITALVAEIEYISKGHLVDATISIGCNNKGAVEKLNRLQIPVSSNTHHFHLFQNIQQILKTCQLKFSFYWIKGQQDDNNDIHEFTREEYLTMLGKSMDQSVNQECLKQDNVYQFDDLDRTRKCSIRWENNDTNDQHYIQSLRGKTLQKLIKSQNTKEHLFHKKKIA